MVFIVWLTNSKLRDLKQKFPISHHSRHNWVVLLLVMPVFIKMKQSAGRLWTSKGCHLSSMLLLSKVISSTLKPIRILKRGRKLLLCRLYALMLCSYLFLRWSQLMSRKQKPFVCGAYTLVNYMEVSCLEQGRLYSFYTIFISKVCVLKWREHFREKSDSFSKHFLNGCIYHALKMSLWTSHLIVLSRIFSSARQTFLTEFSVASSAPPRSVAFVIKLLFQIGIKVNFSGSENTYWGGGVGKIMPHGKNKLATNLHMGWS